MSKKFILEELIEELRSLSEHYELDEDEVDVFVLKPNEVNAFAEDVLKSVKEYLEKELVLDEEEEDEIDADEFDDIFWLDDDDELE